MFEDGFGRERYCDYAVDTPMYFVCRSGVYIDYAGESFRAFLDARLPQLPGQRPRLRDWQDHRSTAFPEVCMKSFLDMRGADGGPWGEICALPALWVGLTYDADALSASLDLVRSWTPADHARLRAEVPTLALVTASPAAARCAT